MDPFNKENKTENAAATPPTTAPSAVSPTPTSPAGPATPPPTTPPSNPVSVAPTLGKPADVSVAPVQTGHVEKSNKMLYLFIGLLLVILIALIGLFFYNQMYQAKAAESKIVVPTTIPVSPTVVIPTYASPEEKDVMGVDVGSVDSQLNIIEKDVNKL